MAKGRSKRGTPRKSKAKPAAGGANLLTRQQLATALETTAGTITRWERDGMPVAERAPRGKPSLFDLQAVRAWRATVDAQPDRAATFSLASAKAKESEKRTEKLELEIGLKRGDLVHRDQVIREAHAFGRAVMAKIRSLPRRAEHSGVIERVQVAGLEALCRELLEEISGWKTFGDLPSPEAKTA